MLGVRVPPGLPFIVVKREGFVKEKRMEKFREVLLKAQYFLKDAWAELKKVTWPTRKQTLASTAVVLVVVFSVSLFLGLIDFGLTKIVKVLLG